MASSLDAAGRAFDGALKFQFRPLDVCLAGRQETFEYSGRIGSHWGIPVEAGKEYRDPLIAGEPLPAGPFPWAPVRADMSADKFDVIIVGAGLPGSILQRWRSSVASRKRASRAGCSWPTIRTFGSNPSSTLSRSASVPTANISLKVTARRHYWGLERLRCFPTGNGRFWHSEILRASSIRLV